MENTLRYKGYFANVNFLADEQLLYGKIEGIDDLVTFQSKDPMKIKQEFENAVDDYLNFCKEVGKEPDKIYKGSFNVRIDCDLHRKIANKAIKNGKSLNQVVETAIRNFVDFGDSAENIYIASINEHLSKISGTLDEFNTSCQVTHMQPGYTYYSTVLPQSVESIKEV